MSPISATASSDDLEGMSPNLKLLSYKNSAIAETIGSQICNQPALVAINTEADGYTENLRDQVVAVLDGCGIAPVVSMSFDSQNDLVALMEAVKASGAESVFLNVVVAESAIVRRSGALRAGGVEFRSFRQSRHDSSA